MGMFDTVSNAVSSVGSPLDTLSNVLSGNAGDTAGANGAKGTVTYLRGYSLDVDQSPKESAGQAANQENALNGAPVIEFIHFGNVHTSHADFFSHESYSDQEKNEKVVPPARPRGIQFRSALEREAILLWLFMKSTEAVLKKREDESAMGGLGSALNMAGSLLGAGGGGSGKTQSSDLVSHEQKVGAAVKPILGESFAYKDIHQAGIDLHQARAGYQALLRKLRDEKPDAGTGGAIGSLVSQASSAPGSIMSGVPAVPGAGGGNGGGVLGTLGTVVSFTQGVAFKAQDIRAKFFVLTALQQEPQIEHACNEMTYQAINQLIKPFLPVWFLKDQPAPQADKWGGPVDPLAASRAQKDNLLNPILDKVDGPVSSGRQYAQDAGNDIKGFFEHAPDATPPPGTEALGMAFNDPPKHLGEKTIIPMAMGDVAVQAFTQVLKLPKIGFAETVVSGIMGVVLEFTKAMYESLLLRDEKKAITGEALLKSASEDIQIVKRLETLALDKLDFLKKAKNFDTSSITTVEGFHVQPGQLLDKEADDLDKIIAEKISPLLGPILKYALDDIADQLDLDRQCGLACQAHTMEWYLGRLPTMQSAFFCNLFFPFWSAMMRAGADLVGGPVGSAIKGALDVADKMKSVTDAARQVVTKAGAYTRAAQKTAESLEDFGTDEKTAKNAAADYRAFKEAGATNASTITTSPKVEQAMSDFPLKGRSEKGKGIKIERPDYDEMTAKKVFKWDDALDPDKPADAANGEPSVPIG